VCCNFGDWHCSHVAKFAGVVFHMLRRERVRARDIFRFGTGMIRTPLKKVFNLATGYQVAGENYLGKSLSCKNEAISCVILEI